MSKQFEEEDPFELMCVSFPVNDDSHLRMMAETFTEEFLRMGWREDAIVRLFRNPFYKAPHAAYKALGEETIRLIIRQVRARVRR